MTIPRILHRTVPMLTSDEVERWWDTARALHPDWDHLTHRDQLDPTEWPLTAEVWHLCSSGAQQAGLIRLEALHRWGGFYLDSDIELYRPLDSLAGCTLVAGYQDTQIIPDAFIAAEAGHPAIRECLDLAVERVTASNGLIRSAHHSGPDVTTEVFQRVPDALLLPPGSFYPYPYTEPERRNEDHRKAQPWAFGAHHWNGQLPGGWAELAGQGRRRRR